jgi:chemotaxis protein CheZ
MAFARRQFRIETISRPGDAGDAPAMGQNSEILAELRELRAFLKAEKKSSPEVMEAWRREVSEALKMRAELEEIQAAIERTKHEIATLHTSGFEGPEMRRVTGELDAIVGGTERATETILSAAEAIDDKAGHLVAAIKDEHDKALATDIQEQVVQIYEACNFQDLTGQRISKIVGVLKFIEERIVRVMDIWGGIETFEGLEAEEMPKAEGDRKLLNGPPIAGDLDRASQDDIDALFA